MDRRIQYVRRYRKWMVFLSSMIMPNIGAFTAWGLKEKLKTVYPQLKIADR